jgi:hypothetical protein
VHVSIRFKKEVKKTKRKIIAFTLIALLALSLTGVVNAAGPVNAQAQASGASTPLVRVSDVSGAKLGIVIINTHTGTFSCYAYGGLQPGKTYYLQYHVTGGTGAGVIGSGAANCFGTVVIVGRLDKTQLDLISSRGNFLIGRYVL